MSSRSHDFESCVPRTKFCRKYAVGRSRTDTGLLPEVFETSAYTSSATTAKLVRGKYTSLPRTNSIILLYQLGYS